MAAPLAIGGALSSFLPSFISALPSLGFSLWGESRRRKQEKRNRQQEMKVRRVQQEGEIADVQRESQRLGEDIRLTTLSGGVLEGTTGTRIANVQRRALQDIERKYML